MGDFQAHRPFSKRLGVIKPGNQASGGQRAHLRPKRLEADAPVFLVIGVDDNNNRNNLFYQLFIAR